MQVAVIGTNHTLSDLNAREPWIQALRKISQQLDLPYRMSYVPVVTCNRCEIYFSSDHLSHTVLFLQKLLEKMLGKSIENHSYTYVSRDCFFHLALVSSGLNSSQIGETDIRRQIKQSYEKALPSISSSDLHFLFQKSLKIGKHFLGSLQGVQKQPSLEKIVVEMCKESLARRSIFFLGNSQMNRKLIQRFLSLGGIEIHLCSQYNGASIPENGVNLVDVSSIHEWKHCDILICATHHDSYLITPSKDPIQTRLIIDLSVPRSVDPQISVVNRLPVVNMDDLNRRLEIHQITYLAQIEKAKQTAALFVDRSFGCFIHKTACFNFQ